MTPSIQQQAVYDAIQNPAAGNLMVISVAGSGKTTTLITGVGYMEGSVAGVAYNKKAAVKLQVWLDAAGLTSKAKMGTAHSFGFQAWRKVATVVKIEDKKNFLLCKAPEDFTHGLSVPKEYCSFVCKAVSLAKQRGIGFLCQMTDRQAWLDMVQHFDLDQELADEEGNLPANADVMIREALNWSCRVLRQGIKIARELIDFDDMIYMPLMGDCRMWQYDWLLVDEAQDTNPARRALYKKMLRPGGRALFVGDPAQAIYGFTGADNDSLSIIKKEFGCTELPLTVTYRCPKAVVQLAQTWVNHIEAHETAPEGVVEQVKQEELLASPDLADRFQPQDAVLCRNTKPLVELAYALIRRSIACHVEGKEIGRGLLALVNKWKVTRLETFVNKLSAWKEKEVARLMAQGKEAAAEATTDKVETIMVLVAACSAEGTVECLRQQINKLFADTPDGQPAQNLTLCTVHKSKGLEWNRVYLLGRNRYMPSKFARQDWQLQQEDNLCYVAVTRAKETLVEVIVPLPVRSSKEAA